jgi:hypothetical protein
MLALAVPMTLLFLGTEVIAHISDRRKARAALAGDDLLIRRSVGDDNALRELSEATTSSSLRGDAPHRDWWSISCRKGVAP